MFGFGAQSQQLRNEQALARMAEPNPKANMKSTGSIEASLRGIDVKAIANKPYEPYVKVVRDDPNVRQAFTDLHFYWNRGNYFACSDCDKGDALTRDPRQGGLNDLVHVHNEQSKPFCSKDVSVVAHLLAQPYMPAQQTTQATFHPSHYQSTTPMPGVHNTQPQYQGFPQSRYYQP